jgi:hypothetical protein
VYFGGNWTDSSLKQQVEGLGWQQAIAATGSLNTLAALVYHIHYYVKVATGFLAGGPLTGNDKESFRHPPIASQQDWNDLLDRVWTEGEKFASLVERLPDKMLMETFGEEKYGSYYRNLQGIIEHAHYHLGQIALIRKLLIENSR